MQLNKNQRIFGVMGLVVIVLMGVYPPWSYDLRREVGSEYRFIWNSFIPSSQILFGMKLFQETLFPEAEENSRNI